MKFKKEYLYFLLIIPALLPLFIVYLLPAFNTIYWSFRDVTFNLDYGFVGLKNYLDAFSSKTFWNSFLKTFQFTITAVMGQVLLGLYAAKLLSKKFRFQKLIVSIVMLPYAVSSVVAIIIWRYMLSLDVGIINYVTQAIGLGTINWGSNPTQAMIVVIVIHVWREFAFTFLILYAAMISIPKSYIDASKIDGASGFQIFRYITFPLIKPALFLSVIFTTIFTFRAFDTVYVLTKGGPLRSTEILSILLYKQAFSYWEFGPASTTAVVLTIITLIFAAIYIKRVSSPRK